MTDKEIRRLKAELIVDLQDVRQQRAAIRAAMMQIGEPLLKLGKRLTAHSLEYDPLSEREITAFDLAKLQQLLTEHAEAAERELRLEKAIEGMKG